MPAPAMTTPRRFGTLIVVAAMLVSLFTTAVGAAPSAGPKGPKAEPPPTYAPEDDFTANWTRAQALEVPSDMGPDTLKPEVSEDFPLMTEEVWVWDTWPLTDLDMNPVSYKGWEVIFSLTAPREGLFFGDRHWVATIGYFYRRDASEDWTYGGDLHNTRTPFAAREWAGSAVLTHGNKVQSFYTASGSPESYGIAGDPYQRLATTPGTIRANADRVWFDGFNDHEVIMEADGEMYQTLEQSQAGPIIYAFRDPFVFRNPGDGEIYALFEGNNGGVAGSHTCDPHEIGDVPDGHVVPNDARFYTGNIGLMRKTGQGMNNWTNWELLPPLVSAECTNQQTERPHLTVVDGTYYLWTISHTFTFAPGLTGPDGLYGFAGESLRSDYEALNGSALALGNPPSMPLMTYSDYVMPNGLVESFIDTVPLEGGGVRYGGTLAPTYELELDGATSRFVQQWPYGYIPPMRNVAGRPIR